MAIKIALSVAHQVGLQRISLLKRVLIGMNEECTEAAAATSVAMETESISEEPFHMEVNRPFFIALTDDQTGTILFVGSISNPEEGE